ncbi:hypothetical protein ANMWB30_24140 [Arthrobacter sp. MWB30]|nr:hypothetical protein ANMWB30_24140 [Arthrobacter sp. MWB30]
MTATTRRLTPYDTGARAEPRIWAAKHRESDDDFGKVDFNTDEDYTVATLWIERRDHGFALKGYANEPLEVDIDDQSGETERRVMEPPTPRLKIRVERVIESLVTQDEREKADIFWQEDRALIVVPGEYFVRKPLIIEVTEDGGVRSAKLSSNRWSDGVRDARIG